MTRFEETRINIRWALRSKHMSNDDRIEANKAIVCRLYRCINQGGGDLFPTIVASSYVDHSNGGTGPDRVRAAAANLHRAYANPHITIADIVAEADLVAIRRIETGRHVEQFFNLKPSGQPCEARGLTFYPIQDGQIVESGLAIDPSTIRAQETAQEALAAGRE